MLKNILDLFLKNGILDQNSILQLSFYKYIPKSQEDFRKTFKINIIDALDKEPLLCEKLENNQEMALDSLVQFQGVNYHIPMIDFKTKNLDIVHKAMHKISKGLKSEFFVVSSGRSYHGYFLTLLTEIEWIKYNGFLLLSNESIPIVDERWVGHRLISGFSSLRLTKNSGHYLKEPNIIFVSDAIAQNQNDISDLTKTIVTA